MIMTILLGVAMVIYRRLHQLAARREARFTYVLSRPAGLAPCLTFAPVPLRNGG